MSKDTGGPAFPNITPNMHIEGGPGMTLRDYFAGQALAGLPDGRRRTAETYATDAYECADAMLAERDKPKGDEV